MVAWVIGMSVAIIICLLHYMINEKPNEEGPLEPPEPFVVSEYYERMEQAALDILEHREAVDKAITLRWGLDELRLNEDGELEWVSRRKPKPVLENVSYQFCQSVPAYNPDLLAQTQSTRSSIDALMAENAMLKFQAAQNMMIANSLAGYGGYSPQMQSMYQSQLMQCCCIQKH